MNSPTLGDLEILNFILAATKRDGYPPTIRELCAEFGWSSTNAGNSRISKLRSYGLIERRKKMTARALVLTAEAKKWLEVEVAS